MVPSRSWYFSIAFGMFTRPGSHALFFPDLDDPDDQSGASWLVERSSDGSRSWGVPSWGFRHGRRGVAVHNNHRINMVYMVIYGGSYMVNIYG